MMPWSRACMILLAVVMVTPALAQPRLGRGVALGLFAEDPGWSYRPLLDEIKALGADHVELVVAWYQEDASSTTLAEHPRYTAPLPTVRQAIRDARAAGLEVVLFPIVRLTHPRSPDEWRGNLKPQDRAAWFKSYSARIGELARLAAHEGVSALSVGSELSSLDGPDDREAWRLLIDRVRQVFAGPLLYSGNWDHFEKVAIYELLDLAGVCAYFALVDREAPFSDEDLTRGWRDWRAELIRFARIIKRPLVLTEVGYRSVHGTAAAPWDERGGGATDLEEQRRCYAAFRRVWSDATGDVLGGVFFWNWYGWGGVTSRGYTPRNKPASDEIRRFFDEKN
jgi:hypothetical protein